MMISFLRMTKIMEVAIAVLPLCSLVNAYPTTYPFTYNVCGLDHTVDETPSRAITMNQGATEFMLALGLGGSMVGTAYLDDAIWPKYTIEYNKIVVLDDDYPDEDTIMNADPDFIIASYNSAFRGQYLKDNVTKGIFGNATVGPCTRAGLSNSTCRPQLHNAGIGTYIFQDHCVDRSLRPTEVTEETVYEELRALAGVFNVDAEPIITEMKVDFSKAAKLVVDNAADLGEKLRVVWLDCVGRCCNTEDGEEPQLFVGGGTGAPHLLMKEAGLTNVFEDKEGGWVCVNETDVISANPDAIVVVDAAWDSAKSKVEYMFNHSEFCEMDAIKGARMVQIPFSATTLSPRNGPAALDLAVASLYVRLGIQEDFTNSGVDYFNVTYLQKITEDLTCKVDTDLVPYSEDRGAGSGITLDLALAATIGLLIAVMF